MVFAPGLVSGCDRRTMRSLKAVPHSPIDRRPGHVDRARRCSSGSAFYRPALVLIPLLDDSLLRPGRHLRSRSTRCSSSFTSRSSSRAEFDQAAATSVQDPPALSLTNFAQGLGGGVPPAGRCRHSSIYFRHSDIWSSFHGVMGDRGFRPFLRRLSPSAAPLPGFTGRRAARSTANT